MHGLSPRVAALDGYGAIRLVNYIRGTVRPPAPHGAGAVGRSIGSGRSGRWRRCGEGFRKTLTGKLTSCSRLARGAGRADGWGSRCFRTIRCCHGRLTKMIGARMSNNEY